MDGEASTHSRRSLLRGGAMAATAGFAWTTPVARSFNVSGAAGSPQPPETAPPPPSVVGYDLAGTFTGAFTRDRAAGGCDATFTAHIDFITLGAATISATLVEDSRGTFRSHDDFMIETARGTLRGTLHGTADGTFAGPFGVDFAGAVTGGSGEYAGATGTVTFKGSGSNAMCLTGTTSGNIDVAMA